MKDNDLIACRTISASSLNNLRELERGAQVILSGILPRIRSSPTSLAVISEIMRAFSWIPWLLAIGVCLADARYKMRRPLPPAPQPPPQMYKKPWPISHRMSMGNNVHIGTNFGPKRPVFAKPGNFRIRRPPPMSPMFNAPPTAWKNPIPLMSSVPNIAVLPQRPPMKEFHVLNNAPQYSPEYRPEPMVLPPTHRGGMDDDKGPIHTIPAPNLSLADKPYNAGEDNNAERQEDYRRFPTESEYSPQPSGPHVTNYGYGTLMTSAEPQRPVTSPTPTQNSYEVTEVNEVKGHQTVTPAFFPTEYESSRVSPGVVPDLQTNELYLSHPPISRVGVLGSNVQFGQSNVPMQTNLHSSLHVGFPGSGAQAPSMPPQMPEHMGQNSEIHVGQQIPDLHVGHPAAAGPPMSANQLYDLLNSFPQPLMDQYASGPQPQLQQHILQQQLGQLFQPEASPTTFSQPQMHSFNYDEQANKRQQQLQQQQEQLQQQQQILIGQDAYASGRVTADYNLEPEQPLDVRSNGGLRQNEGYHPESAEQAENNIEYEEAASAVVNRATPNGYFDAGNEGAMSKQFYTTLPNRETAEKLAALAAAGNVNSHLIGQLKKQQEQQEQEQRQQAQEEDQQSDEPVPSNHHGDYQVNEQVDDVPYEPQEQPRIRTRQRFSAQKRYRQNYRQQQIQREQEEADKHYEQQRLMLQKQQEEAEQEAKQDEEAKDEKRPLRIMVPDVEEGSKNSDNSDYEYENTEPDNSKSTVLPDDSSDLENSSGEFGSRIRTKSEN